MQRSLRPLRVGAHEFAWGSRTYVMGVLNVTPDSFSGDGVTDRQGALARALEMQDHGADVIDVGGESTRPETWSGTGLPADEELNRVLPVIEALRQAVSIPVSIDTYKAEVAVQAVRAGAQMVNDVWGLRRDPAMAQAVAGAGVPLIVMHNQPGTEYHELMDDIVRALEESVRLAEAAGIPRERVICDPGIGFGKTREQNLEILRRLAELRRLTLPILVGPSRKSFIGKTLDLPVDERLEGTAAAVALAIGAGADMVRVHDVRAMVRVARMADAIVRTPAPWHLVWLALGSNLGDRAAYLQAARRALSQAGVAVRRTSRVAETEPVGITDQPCFLNQVLEVETSLEPAPLLRLVKTIEHELGRTNGPRWGPREIDIDVLLHGGQVINEVGLRIPHPELAHRPFLLELLTEVEPGLIHPVAREPVSALLAKSKR